MTKISTLVLFDFDGTITKKDTLVEFIRFVAGDVKFYIGLFVLSPMLILYKLKLIPNYKAKQLLISYFLKGKNEGEFRKIATCYSLNCIDKILRPKAMKRIQWHKGQGHKVVVVSASLDFWVYPWCKKNGLELISSKMNIENGIFTCQFETQNCYGIEKVNQIKKTYNLNDYGYIYAYGDSEGDKEMLELADESYYKPFK